MRKDMEKKKIFFEDVNEGDEIPECKVSNITRTMIVKYAGASGDFNPIHHDELYAIRAGNDRVFAMGMLTAGILSKMITDWVGVGSLHAYRTRFMQRLWPGDDVICKGRLTRKHKEGNEGLIEADVTAMNQRGEVLIRGSFTAVLPQRS